ncbi:hypothetical protein [Actinokineospora sp. HUAS TT18]|uniref:hypothetical protein n=1 Tax=Actinokineospora sp. HUAS TT18 TaxID=3447451 RepID=UPI003F524986
MSLYRRGISLAAAFAMGGFALTACTSAPASPTTVTPTSTAATTAPSATAAPPGSGAPSSAVPAPLLGPDGFGGLKLGMSRDQALATKLITDVPASTSCAVHKLKAGDTGVFISARLGLAAIAYPAGARTPEGIGAGATLPAVKRAYPKLDAIPSGYFADVPGNPAARYVLFVDGDKVKAVDLELKAQDCYR